MFLFGVRGGSGVYWLDSYTATAHGSIYFRRFYKMENMGTDLKPIVQKNVVWFQKGTEIDDQIQIKSSLILLLVG